MPYIIKRVSGDPKPWKIIANGKIIASSQSKTKALASIRYREAYEKNKK